MVKYLKFLHAFVQNDVQMNISISQMCSMPIKVNFALTSMSTF